MAVNQDYVVVPDGVPPGSSAGGAASSSQPARFSPSAYQLSGSQVQGRGPPPPPRAAGARTAAPATLAVGGAAPGEDGAEAE